MTERPHMQTETRKALRTMLTDLEQVVNLDLQRLAQLNAEAERLRKQVEDTKVVMKDIAQLLHETAKRS